MEWISVKVTFPLHGQKVKVRDKYYKEAESIFILCKDNEPFFSEKTRKYLNVTHWKPMETLNER